MLGPGECCDDASGLKWIRAKADVIGSGVCAKERHSIQKLAQGIKESRLELCVVIGTGMMDFQRCVDTQRLGVECFGHVNM